MHEDGCVLGQDDGFLVDWCLSQESSEEAGPAVASSNESIPSPHHRVRAGPEERSSTFPCLITPHLCYASFHSTRHGRVRPLDLGLIRKKLSIFAEHCARASHQLIALLVHALSLEAGPYFPARVSASAYAWSVPGRSRSIGVPATSQPSSPFSRCTSLLR